MGVRSLMHVTLGVLVIKKVGNHCYSRKNLLWGPWHIFSNGGPWANKFGVLDMKKFELRNTFILSGSWPLSLQYFSFT